MWGKKNRAMSMGSGVTWNWGWILILLLLAIWPSTKYWTSVSLRFFFPFPPLPKSLYTQMRVHYIPGFKAHPYYFSWRCSEFPNWFVWKRSSVFITQLSLFSFLLRDRLASRSIYSAQLLHAIGDPSDRKSVHRSSNAWACLHFS